MFRHINVKCCVFTIMIVEHVTTISHIKQGLHIMHLGPLHTQAKSRDLVMVRTLDSHPKAVP